MWYSHHKRVKPLEGFSPGRACFFLALGSIQRSSTFFFLSIKYLFHYTHTITSYTSLPIDIQFGKLQYYPPNMGFDSKLPAFKLMGTFLRCYISYKTTYLLLTGRRKLRSAYLFTGLCTQSVKLFAEFQEANYRI